MTFIDQRLSNGLRVVIEPMPAVRSMACGFMARTGSRDEVPRDAGMSHFLEHMCFKGTRRRTWQQITADFDDLGSTYNAFTSKERTFYYGWVRGGDMPRQLDILADLVRPTLPQGEFDTEKNVILEEIAQSHDQLESHVYDLIHEKAFAGHPLQWPVLGDSNSVGAMTRDAMWGYVEARYNPANVVLVAAGAIEPSAFLAEAERLTADWLPGPARPLRVAPPGCPTGRSSLRLERFKQQAICLVFNAPGSDNERFDEVASATASILGGANSRFYWKIVQAGVAPVAGAWRVDYCDTGLMVLYGFSEPERTAALLDAIRREADVLGREGAREDELTRVKNRRRTGLVTEAESPYYRLVQLADDVDTYGKPRTVDERMERLERITVNDIRDYLQQWPITGDSLMLSAGPA